MSEILTDENLNKSTAEICKECGEELKLVKLCSSCKTLVYQTEETIGKKKFCVKCGKEMENGKYCKTCKKVIKQRPQVKNAEPVQENEVEEKTDKTQKAKRLIPIIALILLIIFGGGSIIKNVLDSSEIESEITIDKENSYNKNNKTENSNPYSINRENLNNDSTESTKSYTVIPITGCQLIDIDYERNCSIVQQKCDYCGKLASKLYDPLPSISKKSGRSNFLCSCGKTSYTQYEVLVSEK